MAGFNGSGTFVRVHNWVTDKANTVKVTASRMDAEDDGFATGLSTVICKDGQTTTTAAIPFGSGINVSDGSVGTPAIKWISDTDSGFYRIGANNLGLSLGGAKVWDYGTATASAAGSLALGGTLAVTGAITATGGLVFGAGTEASPSITFSGDTNTGFYASAADAVGLSLGGSKVVDYTTTGVAVTGTLSSTGNLTVGSNKLTVTGASGNTAVAGTLAVTGASTLTGATEVTGNLSVNTNKFTVTAASGNAAIAGTLAVTGAATFTGDVSAATVSGAQVADQSGQETGTSTTTIVTPGRQHFHNSAAKIWGQLNASGGISANYNITSIVDAGTGLVDVTFATDFADTNYVITNGAEANGLIDIMISVSTAKTAGTLRFAAANSTTAAAADTVYHFVGFGDFA